MNVSRTTPSAPSPLRAALDQRIEAGELELPLLPHVASQVLAACSDEACDARRLTELIHNDQALAAHVLRVSNSPLYCPREPIVSLQQAVARLGFGNICKIAIAVAVQGRICGAPGHEALVRALWSHAVAAGAYAQEIARLRRRNVEGAFLCGLLHDIGRPVILQSMLDLARQEGVEAGEPELLEAMDALHAAVGVHLIETWGFPDWMQAAARHHHDPEAAGEHVELARTTGFADLLSHWALDEELDAGGAPHGHPLLAALELYADQLTDLLEQRARVLETVEAFRG